MHAARLGGASPAAGSVLELVLLPLQGARCSWSPPRCSSGPRGEEKGGRNLPCQQRERSAGRSTPQQVRAAALPALPTSFLSPSAGLLQSSRCPRHFPGRKCPLLEPLGVSHQCFEVILKKTKRFWRKPGPERWGLLRSCVHSTTPSVHGRKKLALNGRVSVAGQSWGLGIAVSGEQRRWRCSPAGRGWRQGSCGAERTRVCGELRRGAEQTRIRSQKAALKPSSLGGDAWEDADRRLNQPGGGAGNHHCRRREGLAQRPLPPSPRAQQRPRLSAQENAQNLDPRPGGTCPFRPSRGTEERRRVVVQPGAGGR